MTSRLSEMGRTAVDAPLLRQESRRPLLGPVTAPWRRLTHEIWTCRRCPLAASRTHAVAYRGARSPWVVFVGEAPGAQEDRQGLPFVGRGGELLDRTTALVGLTSTDFGIVNVLKCRPPRNRFDATAALACRPYLDRQLDLLAPRAIVTLGARALRALDPSAPPMLRAAGSPRVGRGRPLFPMVHPAATFRARRMAERWTHDTAKLSVWLRSVRPART